MKIPAGVIFIWTGNNNEIPVGWARETALDGKYPKGTPDSTNPNQTGGNSTHEHTVSGTHTHTMVNHTHNVSLQAHTYNSDVAGGSSTYVVPSHTHATFSSGNSSGGDLSAVSSSYSAISNDPPYYTVIFIRSQYGLSGIPNLALFFSDDEDFENNTGKYFGCYQCNGDNDTPDLRNKYLKGADTDANAGSTGGSTTNVHTLTHASSHSVSSHTHASKTSPAVSGTRSGTNSTSSNWLDVHTHSIALNASTASVSSANPSITTSETVEPEFRKLLPVQNRSGGNYVTTDIIGLWLGTLANIPVGWELITEFNNKFVKCANDTSEIGDTGGSSTHTHTNNTHTHTASATHTHTATGAEHTTGNHGDGGEDSASRGTNAHPVSVQDITATYNNGTTSAESSNNEPEYRTTALIRLVKITGGAGMFL